jgi:ATP-dependent helicase/nuclease subunit A
VLPEWPLSPEDKAQKAFKDVADSVDSRIGQAMHRLLEWAPVASDEAAQTAWTAEQCRAVAQEFALEAAQAEQALSMARQMVQGQAAWAWDASELAWYGNEVGLVYAGRLLRIDRLVQRCDTGEWWVLDYKSSAQPQLQKELCTQLLDYRNAVVNAQPGSRVRAAFLTPEGRLIEMINT